MVILALKRGDREIETLSDLEGLFQEQPIFALTLGVMVFSFAGIPPFFGFWTKFHLIINAMHAGLYAQVVGMLVGSLLALGYYLRILKAVILKENKDAFLTAHPFKLHFVVILSILLGGAFLWQGPIFSFIGNLL
jgi:NADH-quinone oxidoreductase subunit N